MIPGSACTSALSLATHQNEWHGACTDPLTVLPAVISWWTDKEWVTLQQLSRVSLCHWPRGTSHLHLVLLYFWGPFHLQLEKEIQAFLAVTLDRSAWHTGRLLCQTLSDTNVEQPSLTELKAEMQHWIAELVQGLQHLPARSPGHGCVLPQHTAQVLPHSWPKVFVTLGTGSSPAHDKICKIEADTAEDSSLSCALNSCFYA